MTDKVWLLERTEEAGQCTGFPSETKVLAIFTKKPDLKTVAPMMGSCLSGDMGEAIGQVATLIDKGSIEIRWDLSFELYQVPLNSRLKSE